MKKEKKIMPSDMKATILLVTATATFWGTIHAGAENIKANWVSTSQLAVSYTVNGQAHGGYVVPSVTTSPQQIRNLWGKRAGLLLCAY